MGTGGNSFDSLRRRLRYGAWRTAYISWHAIVREAGVHAGGAIAIGLCIAIFVERLQPVFEWPLWVCLSPAVAGCVYALVVMVICYRRVAAEFPAMRQRMRDRRMWDLRMGGVTRKRFKRLTWLRVTLPFWVMMALGVVLAIRLFPVNDWRPKIFLMMTAGVAMAFSAWMDRWNQRRSPRNLHRLCPRCGYDVSGSMERCPECGLKRFIHPAMRQTYDFARLARDFEEDEEDEDDDGF